MNPKIIMNIDMMMIIIIIHIVENTVYDLNLFTFPNCDFMPVVIQATIESIEWFLFF